MVIEKNIKNWYLENYNRFEENFNSTVFKNIRKVASTKFESSQFPTKKNEEWKYTNVAPILNHEFLPSPLINEKPKSLNINNYVISNLDVHLLVFVNGIFNSSLSNIGNLSRNIIIDSLYNQSINNSEFISKIINTEQSSLNSFNYLNHLFTHDGFVIYIPKNQIIEKPIHILNISQQGSSKPLVQLRNFIVAESNTQANIISEFISDGSSQYFTNILTDIFIEENSNISFYKLQNESNSAYHIDKTEIIQKTSSVFNHFSLSFGGKITRNDIVAKLDGENIESHLYGLYLGNEEQHIDNHTFINHAKPNSMSNELYKGILDDKAHGVFSGKILVNQIAQKTNAYQSNKSVLLSDAASIDTKPQLEIYADDVKCSHGATVGKLDEQAYFYIRSRGVSAEAARSMLIRAFVDDVVSEVKIDQLKDKINHTIFQHLHRVEF